MSVHIVRLGSERGANEGLRIGTVRRPPRGVRREDFANDNWYDVWMPLLSPSSDAVKQALSAESDIDWAKFVKRYRREMSQADAARNLDLLAALSHQTDFSVGCYCLNEQRCHRSILAELLVERGAALAKRAHQGDA